MSPTLGQGYSCSRCCPRCGSGRLKPPIQRGALGYLLAIFGGQILHCRECRLRRAWLGYTSIPIGQTNATSSAVAAAATAFVAGFVMILRSAR